MFAVQPANWHRFDEYGADHTISISHAYRIAAAWFATGENEGQDMMIWRLTSGRPIKWVRVYQDESIDSVTTEELALLT